MTRNEQLTASLKGTEIAPDLKANVGAEHVIDLLPEIIKEAATEVSTTRLRAVVVKIPMFGPHMKLSELRAQVEAAFPGVPVIVVDQGTDVQVIHAVE